MTLLLAMLPLYLAGNLHCMGMCGPLVLMIGRHAHRNWYFLGRLVSYTLAGYIAGSAGALLNATLQQYAIPAAASLLFGAWIFALGISGLTGWQIPGTQTLSTKLGGIQRTLTLLILQDKPLATFLFGFFTLALPCGQTILVYSTLALYGDPLAGTLNGLAFALLTSPSLWASMQAQRLLNISRRHYNTLMGTCALVVGILALCRGLAELDFIPHLVLSENWHLVIF